MSLGTPHVSLVAGDRKPELACSLGEDLTGYTVTMKIRFEDGSSLEKTATIDDTEAGEFHFEWDAGDLVVGTHAAEIVFVDSDGLPETWPADAPLDLVVRSEV
jgi:hypothetical protein